MLIITPCDQLIGPRQSWLWPCFFVTNADFAYRCQNMGFGFKRFDYPKIRKMLITFGIDGGGAGFIALLTFRGTVNQGDSDAVMGGA